MRLAGVSRAFTLMVDLATVVNESTTRVIGSTTMV
jgi:hypothetical protein